METGCIILLPQFSKTKLGPQQGGAFVSHLTMVILHFAPCFDTSDGESCPTGVHFPVTHIQATETKKPTTRLAGAAAILFI